MGPTKQLNGIKYDLQWLEHPPNWLVNINPDVCNVQRSLENAYPQALRDSVPRDVFFSF